MLLHLFVITQLHLTQLLMELDAFSQPMPQTEVEKVERNFKRT
jgi:hypothetical protein